MKAYAKEYKWKLITNSNRKQVFMEMVQKMDMSYSYKPVLLKAILSNADDDGKVRLSDIVDYFRDFYKKRRSSGLIVEKRNCIYTREGYTDKEAERNILANPFKRFQDMNMMRHTKTMGIIQMDQSVWKRLTPGEKEEIVRICDEKLDGYFEKLEKKAEEGQ